MSRTLWTIGHSNHPIEQFLKLLATYEIQVLVDVRSVPYSKRYPHYKKEALRGALERSGINYLYAGGELGARPQGFSSQDGYDRADPLRLEKSPGFQAGIQRLLENVEKEKRIALMCAEADPLACHRFALIAYPVFRTGVEVRHILRGGGIERQEESEARMLAELGLNAAQPDLFDSCTTESGQLEKARRHNMHKVFCRSLSGFGKEDLLKKE